MDGLRARFQKKGVSREASNLTIKSRRSSSNPNYKSPQVKLTGWCTERKIDPLCSNINQILEVLSQLIQNGLQYRTINNYRSAISAFHWLLVFLIVDPHNQDTVLLECPDSD